MGKANLTLMELLVYARLVKVQLESIVDDTISVGAFRVVLRGTSGRTYNEH